LLGTRRDLQKQTADYLYLYARRTPTWRRWPQL
jgi:hypothetical protein